MDPLLLPLTLAALGTAALSATFGMAGGLVLMGLYTMLLPVPEAMVLHGVTQLVSNASRATFLRGHIQWNRLGWYAVGAGAAWGTMRLVHYVPEPVVVYFGLGLLPVVATLVPAHPAFDFARRRGAALCGFGVVGLQTLFGVAGPLLDSFFVRTTLTRHEVVATKATSQALSHALKIGYFVPLLAGSGERLPGWATASVVAAMAGTWLGGRVLERMSEGTFRALTRRLILGIGAFYLCRGAWELVGGPL